MIELGLSADAEGFGEVVADAIAARGGFDLVMQAEAKPASRTTLVESLLDELGVWELESTADETQLQASATVCRVAGRFALPYPVAERLACPPDVAAQAVAAVIGSPRVNMADLPLKWVAVDASDAIAGLRAVGEPLGTKLGSFVVPCEVGRPHAESPGLFALSLTLLSFTLLGMIDSAFDLTVRHVREREQFGDRLVQFQGVQFQLADALVSRQCVGELANYALWSVSRNHAESLVDAIALRSSALNCADVVFRIAHQLHGATGFCDESAVSWLSRYSHPLRRLPLNGPETDEMLAELVAARGFDGLFARGRTVS